MNPYQKHFQQMQKNTKSAKGGKSPKRMSVGYHSNRVKKHSALSQGMGLLSLLAFCLTLYGFLYPEKVGMILSNVKIGFLSQSMASDAAHSAAPAPKKEEKPAGDPPVGSGAKAYTQAPIVSENVNNVEQLMEKEKELDVREKRLVEMEAKLQQHKDELDQKIQALEKARREIASRLETRVSQDQESIDKLVGVYSNMKPQNAAQVISKLDDELAISLLKKMKKQDAGSILNFMDPQKAKALSEKYSGY